MKLIVGLGNPGTRYEGTRHNVGSDLILSMAGRLRLKIQEKKSLKAWVSMSDLDEQQLIFAIPTTYMNSSGQAVLRLVKEYSINVVEDLLIIVDDVALPFGNLRLRVSGSDGGHNGLKSVEGSLETVVYPRIRCGVGPESEESLRGVVLEDYVLDKPELKTILDGYTTWQIDFQEQYGTLIESISRIRTSLKETKGQTEIVYLEKMCTDAHRKLEVMAGNVNMSTEVDPEISIQCNPRRMRLTVENLLLNALEAAQETDEPSVTFEVKKTAEGTTQIRVQNSTKWSNPNEMTTIVERMGDTSLEPFSTKNKDQRQRGTGVPFIKETIRGLGGKYTVNGSYKENVLEQIITLP